ncbi:xylose isomerase [Candidatus Poribacteria bacterium]|nr:xylose isomerase [Candidatus Poribacteria bacterium]MEE2910524.1 xylose isomerase [Candidatus Poribacteria bacterium]|tara:strand:- start:398 stop:1567 length:1170 start_codon:yes stop_codon:yes gene_type:complete
MSDLFQPNPSDQFTFGLWTVGNPGRDPFGDIVRPTINPIESVRKLSQLGAYGVNLHDNDLVPFDASPSERDQIVKDFKQALNDHGMKVPMATTNLFFHPVFRDGAFTSNDPKVRAFAVQKTMSAIDLGVELGAKIYVFWGGREGAEVDASKNGPDTIKWFRDSINFLCDYVKDQGYDLKFALEPKPNEPRGDIYMPTVGHMLHFIETLEDSSMVGVNPEFAHETMAGLNFLHGVSQALEAGKLFHIDLNDQKMGRFDQDLRFGSENIKAAFLLVKLLEDNEWGGMRHFDAHAYRTEDQEGVWDFAAGCMRTYLILKEKVNQFNEDSEIQGILAEVQAKDTELEALISGYSNDKAQKLRSTDFDPDEIASKGCSYEKLDQLTVEILLGVR